MRFLVLLCLVLYSVPFLAGCDGEQLAAPPEPPQVALPANSPMPPPTPAAAASAPTGFGFGPVTLRINGTTPRTGAGTQYVGDCDNAQPDDDFEVMTFSAPWKIVGSNSGGHGAGMGSPSSRSFIFEKNPDIGEKRFKLDFGRERSDATAESLTAGLTRVADLEFGNSSVGLFFVAESGELAFGYAALFPIAQITGLPPEPEFTGRYIARVSFTPVGPLDFEGWSQAEIVQLYMSVYSERCLGEQLGSFFAALGATTVYE